MHDDMWKLIFEIKDHQHLTHNKCYSLTRLQHQFHFKTRRQSNTDKVLRTTPVCLLTKQDAFLKSTLPIFL